YGMKESLILSATRTCPGEQSKDAQAQSSRDADRFAIFSGKPRDALAEQPEETGAVDRLQDPGVYRPAAPAAPIDHGHAHRRFALGLDRDIGLTAVEQLGREEVGDDARIVH